MLKLTMDRRLGRYRLEHPVLVNQPIILISQIQRSGGTMLSRLLDDHPQILAHPYELSWGRPEKWHWPDPDPGARPRDLFAQLTQDWVIRLSRRAYYKKGEKRRVTIHPFIFDYPLQRDLFQQLMQERPPSSPRGVLDHYLTSLFNAWYDYQNLYRGGDKRFVSAFTPRVLMEPLSVERFDRQYPDGLVLSSVRHPAGWYASAIRHKYEERYGSLAAVLDLWLRSTRTILDAKARTRPAYDRGQLRGHRGRS